MNKTTEYSFNFYWSYYYSAGYFGYDELSD